MFSTNIHLSKNFICIINCSSKIVSHSAYNFWIPFFYRFIIFKIIILFCTWIKTKNLNFLKNYYDDAKFIFYEFINNCSQKRYLKTGNLKVGLPLVNSLQAAKRSCFTYLFGSKLSIPLLKPV